MPGSQTSGSRTTHSDVDVSVPRSLYRVAFRGKNLAHWALFLPDVDGQTTGTLFHVGVDTNRSGTKAHHRLRVKKILLDTSSATSARIIRNATMTRTMLTPVAEQVYRRKGYNAVTNNCQHFCLDVVAELHRVYPEFVHGEAVDDVARNGTFLTSARTSSRRTRESSWSCFS